MKYGDFKMLVQDAGWGLGEFARMVGLDPRSLSNYSQGKKEDKKGKRERKGKEERDDLPILYVIVAVLIAELIRSGVPKQEITNKLSEMKLTPKPKKPRGNPRGLRHRPAVHGPNAAIPVHQEGT